MLHSELVTFTSNLAQAGAAAVLAMVLVAFHRLYGRPYLLTWAWSWWAFCLSLLGGSVSLFLVGSMPPQAPLRLIASSALLLGGYWQIAWLLFGTYEVVRDRPLAPWVRRAALAGTALLALGSVVLTLYVSSQARFLVRVGPPCLLLATAFFIASWGVRRSPFHSSGLGRRLVSVSFFLYGLLQLAYAVIIVTPQVVKVGPMTYSSYLGPFDFLFQFLIGIGLVTWLLEGERQRVLAASERIAHLAQHDSLTDLPNRGLLLQRLQEAIDSVQSRRERLAVLFLDLDRFKVVNESMGIRHGDELLKALSDRLQRNLRSTDQVARLAADEFAILLPGIESETATVRVAEKLLGVTRLPFTLQGREIYLTASIGVSRFPEDGSDAETLLKRAEIAMVRAKETRRDHYQLYSLGMDSHSLAQLSLGADLRRAMQEDGGLALFYQPVLDYEQRRIDGVEALLRWFHPTRGLMGPGEFLWLAESSDLSHALDLWVLRTACREIQGWRAAGRPDLQLAVNLSPRSFQEPDLLRNVQRVLAETGFPASLLVLEITETLAMQNAEATLAVLKALKELGVRIAIDDFGTGYSSLSYLTTFPIDTLKVDRSFVHTIGQSRGSEEVAAAVIALAVSLEIGVIAEGVESPEQWSWLEGLGCGRFQGYLFSPPLSAADCRELALHGDLDAQIARVEEVPRSA